MPIRKIPLVNQETYHVFNRSVGKQPIFRFNNEYNLFTNIIWYYRHQHPTIRYSFFSRLNQENKENYLSHFDNSGLFLVNILSFCIMPNHYHFILKQNLENGIMNFIRLIQNSYAKYVNIKTKRSGALFQSPFKAVRIESEEQFVHVARYIHLNPLTSYILENFDDLASFDWNSYKDYVSGSPRSWISSESLLSIFGNSESLQKFTRNNVDYQRKLSMIKHLIFE